MQSNAVCTTYGFHIILYYTVWESIPFKAIIKYTEFMWQVPIAVFHAQ